MLYTKSDADWVQLEKEDVTLLFFSRTCCVWAVVKIPFVTER